MNKKWLCIAVISAILFSGCKKVASDQYAIAEGNAASQRVQEWFTAKSAENAGNSAYTARRSGLHGGQPNWDETKFYAGNALYVTPLKMNTAADNMTGKYLVNEEGNGKIISGDYWYIIPDKNKMTAASLKALSAPTADFFSLKNIPHSFSGSIIKHDMQDNPVFSKHYDNGKPALDKADKLVAKSKAGSENTSSLMNLACGECVEWWDITYNVNTGEVINEVYLYTECGDCDEGGTGSNTPTNPPGGNGTPSSQQQCQNALDEMVSNTKITSTTRSIDLISESPGERTKKYQWVCLKNLTWAFLSTDYGKHKYVPTPSPYTPDWEWVSFTHQSLTYEGLSIGGSVTLVNTEPSATVGKYNSVMNLDVTLRYDVVCSFNPLPGLTVMYPCHKAFSVDSPGQIINL